MSNPNKSTLDLPPDPIRWYDAHAAEVAPRYESLAPETVHAWLIDRLPPPPARVLDVGAGTGRDAAWLASRGYEVVAAEPSAAMRAEAQRRHAGVAVKWVADALPELAATRGLGLAFDAVLLSAVWMHVRPADRAKAFGHLAAVLKPGGMMALTLRHGPGPTERGFYPVSAAEIERLARAHGARVERLIEGEDLLGRAGVTWTRVVVRAGE